MNLIKYLFKEKYDILRQRIHRHVYMRKLHFVVKTARQFHKETGRKYYIVNDVGGNPVFLTAVQLNEYKAKKIIPKTWTHVDMEQNSIHVIPDGRK